MKHESEKLKEREYLGDKDVIERIILKWIFREIIFEDVD
jgi:hypothetical protein